MKEDLSASQKEAQRGIYHFATQQDHLGVPRARY